MDKEYNFLTMEIDTKVCTRMENPKGKAAMPGTTVQITKDSSKMD